MKERKNRKITLVFPGIFLLFQKKRQSGGSGAVCEWRKINVFADGKFLARKTYEYEKIHIVRAAGTFLKDCFTLCVRDDRQRSFFSRLCKAGLRIWPAYKKRRKVFKKKRCGLRFMLKKSG